MYPYEKIYPVNLLLKNVYNKEPGQGNNKKKNETGKLQWGFERNEFLVVKAANMRMRNLGFQDFTHARFLVPILRMRILGS